MIRVDRGVFLLSSGIWSKFIRGLDIAVIRVFRFMGFGFWRVREKLYVEELYVWILYLFVLVILIGGFR